MIEPFAPYRPPSPAQRRARERNWRIMRLRSLYATASILSDGRMEAVQAIIDDELRAMGAETHAEKLADLRSIDDE